MASKARRIIPSVFHGGVPLYSQFLDVPSRPWKRRACGAVALRSMLMYWNISISASQLIREGQHLNAFVPGIGWTHKGLAQLAKRHGLYGKNFDWAKKTPNDAFHSLMTHLRKYPVIASIHHDFKTKNTGHLIVLTGYNTSTIFYNEPASKTRKNITQHISLSRFLYGWKRRIIVVKQNKRTT